MVRSKGVGGDSDADSKAKKRSHVYRMDGLDEYYENDDISC